MQLRWLGMSVVLLVACSGDGGSGDGASSETGTVTAETGECPIGALSCSCTQGGACDEGLQCVGGTCVPGDPPATTDDGEADAADSSATDPSDTGSTGSGTTTGDTASTSEGSETGEPVDLDAWTRRRPVLVPNNNDTDLVEYQAKIDIDWDDDMAPLLLDLRFTDADGVLLPHWVESMIAPVEARIWVRVPFVPAGDETTIWMWYGNPEADNVSDGATTFDLWNDFEEDLDETIWTITDDAVVEDGRLTISTGVVVSNEPLLELPGWLLEMRARWPGPAGNSSGLTAAESQGNIGAQDIVQMVQAPLENIALDDGMSVVYEQWQSAPGAPSDQFEWYGFGGGSGVTRFSRTHENDDSTLWWHDFAGEIPNDYYLWLGHGYGVNGEGAVCRQIEIDLLLARKFAEEPPATTIGGEEDV